jgi:N-acetylneuraminic acid mutarotase
MKRTRFASRTTLALTIVMVVSQIQLSAQQGTWVAKAPMPTARLAAAAASVNGTIYVIGGDTNWFGCGFTGVNEAYNPATDTWTTMAPMPTARAAFAAAVLNGIIYVVGGNEGCFPPSRVVEAYDPATNTWSTKAQFPDTGSGLGVTDSAVGVINGILYVAGGSNGLNGGFSNLYAYDPVSDSWSAKTSMPTIRNSEAGAVVNGAFYVVGGTDGVGQATSTFAYDPPSNTWSAKASLSDPRGGLAASVVGNIIYTMGGIDASGPVPIATMESYDPATNIWTTLPSMPTGVYAPSAAQVNGTIFVMGGLLSQSSGAISASVEAFTPVSAPPLVGDGSAITNLTAANISSGTAGINITGNAATASSASGLSCTGCVGNTQLGVNYAGSASQAGPATTALSAGQASLATNSLALGGILAPNFARLDIGNAFTGNQSVAGNVAVTGTVALGSGGTPILKHLSLTINPTFPALGPLVCRSANLTLTGASDGDTIALGVPNSRMTGGGTLNYFAWTAASNTITIRVCNIDLTKQTTAGSGAIRVDVWKH